MWIFGPLPCSTISPVTVTLANAAASLVTVSPSTSRMAGRATVSPAAPARRLIVNVSPTATLCWLPPAFTTAYTTDSSFASSCPRAHDRSDRRVLDGLRTPDPAAPGGARAVAVQPDQRTRAAHGRSTQAGGPPPGAPRVCEGHSGRGGFQETGGPAGRLAARRRRGRAVVPAAAGAATAGSSTAGSSAAGSSTTGASDGVTSDGMTSDGMTSDGNSSTGATATATASAAAGSAVGSSSP